MDATPPSPAKPARKWLRVAIYLFATVGLLLTLTIAYFAFSAKTKPADRSFDTNEAIDGIMTRNYGKYSPADKAWHYVDEARHETYLVTVVQQKKVNGKEGDELYLVTSGRVIESKDGPLSFYGVFQLRYRDGQLHEYGDARRPSGFHPVTPEQVHFEALSADVWGWVVKLLTIEDGDGEAFTTTLNVVLAPRDEQIAVLGEFYAEYQILGTDNCEETERYYASWKKKQDKRQLAPAEGEGSPESASEELTEEDVMEPPRCTTLQWSYRTDPVTNATFTPLYISRKAGMKEGVKVDAKTWKVMFDPKSYTYLLPDELKYPGT
ncbi:hypothetical protein [Pseudoduganella violaceinigra]|uniref:hypothetical protein n=1 Tax=Pseudoduganella violaceinigra TaxID=246602 RepID=UPI00042307DA|nr:hypothetical protein [Pseudoduganella violaceinigra]